MIISFFQPILSAIGFSSSSCSKTTEECQDGQNVKSQNSENFSTRQKQPSSCSQGAKNLDNDELDNWVAPQIIRKNFPYFHAGFDTEGRPCWIAECGKWNAREVSEGGEEMLNDYDKFTDQLLHRLVKSMGERNSPDGSPVDTLNLLVDMDQFSFMQVMHVPTILLIYRTVGKYIPVLGKHLNVGIVVNTNAPAYRIVAMISPLMGRIMERVEIYGTDRAIWVPQLLRRIPADRLPESLGGSRYFKPLKFYGG